MTWREHAACRGKTDLFFDETEHGIARAKKICNTCTVRSTCLEDALAVEVELRLSDAGGVRGGLDERERRNIIRKAPNRVVLPTNTAPCGTVAAYKRHRRYKEPACEACLEANRVASAHTRPSRSKKVPA